MKGLGLALAFALVAVVWQAAPLGHSAQDGSVVTAGIDAGGAPAGSAPRSACLQADSDWLSGCEGDELRRIVVASIDGSD